MTFALDRFEWRARELVLSGHWERPRRFRHVRLVVEERRIAPASQATGEDGTWSVVFPWEDDDPPETPCLEVGHDLLLELPAPDRVAVPAAGPPAAELALEREALEQERAQLEREREELVVQRAVLERELKALEADRALRERAAAPVPSPAVPRNPLDLPRQPGEPVRGQAPTAIRAIAVALCSGVVLALVLLLSVIF